MNEVMTIEEMNSRFDSEWVLIGDPETDEYLQVKRGQVLWHGKDRDLVYRKAAELKPMRFATHYTGPIVPEGTELAL